LFELAVVKFIIGLVEFTRISESSSIETGEPDRKGLVERQVSGLF
jgi:hypothetical protein